MPALSVFVALLAVVMAFLPRSPFTTVINSISDIPYLSYFNWFFPVSECVAVLEAWIAVVAVFYLYSAIMRWIKIIK